MTGAILKSRRYRNRRLGDFLKELELSEGRATGIPTIQEELRKNGSPRAVIKTDEDRTYFLIEIPCRSGFEPQNEPQNEPQISDRQKEIIMLISDLKGISRKEMAEKLKVSYATIKRDINILVRNKIICHVGPSKGGYWKTLKNK